MIHAAPAIAQTPPPDWIAGLAPVMRLRPGRMHEFCGPARILLGAWAMAQVAGPVLWIRLRWGAGVICPQGLTDWAGPERLITLTAAREAEALACAEEALRSGAVALVLVDLASPPALTPLRRLHLAAEAGLARAQASDKGATVQAAILTPEMGGTAGIESRWHLAPCPAPEASCPPIPAWRLQRLRARMAPPATWEVHGATWHELRLRAC